MALIISRGNGRNVRSKKPREKGFAKLKMNYGKNVINECQNTHFAWVEAMTAKPASCEFVSQIFSSNQRVFRVNNCI